MTVPEDANPASPHEPSRGDAGHVNATSAEDHLDDAFGVLTGSTDVVPELPAPAVEPEVELPAPTSRREARERAAALADRDQRRAQANAAIADAPEPASDSGKKGRKASGSKPKKERRRGRVLLVWLIIVAIVAGLGVGTAVTWNQYIHPLIERVFPTPPADYEGTGTDQVTVSIASGDNGSDIARTLYNSGVTASTGAFYQLLLSYSKEPVFQPGLYSLRKEMSAKSALEALQNKGNRLEGKVLLREGQTGKEALQALADGTGRDLAEFEAAVADLSVYTGLPDNAVTLEGWLFPATYTFRDDQTPVQMVQTMISRTHQALTEAGMTDEQVKSDGERVLTIASIVQREARQADDFPKVARVIENRLADDMLLQMDSTAQYGKSEVSGSVWSSAAALNDENDWNTYTRKGLPATPISNPGDAAIQAALHPADGSWIFFVTVNLATGETVFTNTLAEHDAAVAKLRTWCSENPGQGC